MATVEDILNQARRLPPQDRLQLIQELLLTLEPDTASLDESKWNAAWLPELQARVAAYERGETTASDWQSAMQRLRQPHNQSQQSRNW